MNWLAPDSKFMRAWSNLVDGVWINILMLVTSIPIITIGAALTAGHDACRRSIEGEGKGVTSNYLYKIPDKEYEHSGRLLHRVQLLLCP